MIEEIYLFHITTNDEKYKNVCNNIIDDMLMNLNKFPIETILKKLTIMQKNLILDYYYISEKLYNSFYEDRDLYINICETFVVYKGFNNINNLDAFKEFIVPFSTAIDIEKVLHWTDNEHIVYKILVNKKTKFLCIDNTNEGREVVLPCGELTKICNYNEIIKNVYYNIVECFFTETENVIK
jgi:hypothetical protein